MAFRGAESWKRDAKMGRNGDAYLHESRRSFVLISRELARFLNSAEIAAK